MSKRPDAVRVVPVPGLLFEPVETSPEEAAALVATGSFMYEAAPAAEQAAPAAEVSGDDAG